MLLLEISQPGGKAHRNDGSFILYLNVWQMLCIIFPDNEGGGLGLGGFVWGGGLLSQGLM